MKRRFGPAYPIKYSMFGERAVLLERAEEGAPGADGGASSGEEGDSNGGDQPQVRTFREDVLPAEFRGKSEHEVQVLMSTMVDSLRRQNERLRELESRRESEPATVTHQQGVPEPEVSLSELILEDPEKAIETYLQKKGYVSQFQNLDTRTGEMTLRLMRNEIEDFREHEEDVKKILKDSGAAMNEQNIMGAYTMVVGRKSLEERQKARREAASMEKSKPRNTEEAPKAEWRSSLERDMAMAQGFESPEEWAKYMNTDLNVNLPTGVRK